MSRGGSRPGSGTKRRFIGLKNLSVTLDQPTLAILERWGELTGANRSEAIRDLIARGAAATLYKRKGEK